MKPKIFRKKPVEIEAVQWTGKNVFEVYSFIHATPTLNSDIARDRWCDFEDVHLGKDWHIKTLEDGPNGEAKHVASVGDWIIKGVKGEFYPCKPDIFQMTYDASLAAAVQEGEAKPVAWRTRGMNALGGWQPWKMIGREEAAIWRGDPSFKNGRRQIEPLYAHPAPADAGGG